jgi:hypothetical protein
MLRAEPPPAGKPPFTGQIYLVKHFDFKIHTSPKLGVSNLNLRSVNPAQNEAGGYTNA